MKYEAPDPLSIHGIRFANYRALVRQYEEQVEREGAPSRGILNRFADKVGISARYLSHINNYRKRIGDATCRSIENAFGLPSSWMDTNHALLADPATELEAEFTLLVLRLYRESPTEVQALLMRYMAENLMRCQTRAVTTTNVTERDP